MEFTRMSLPSLKRVLPFQVASFFSTFSIKDCQSSLVSEVTLIGSSRQINSKTLRFQLRMVAASSLLHIYLDCKQIIWGRFIVRMMCLMMYRRVRKPNFERSYCLVILIGPTPHCCWSPYDTRFLLLFQQNTRYYTKC